MATKKAIFNDSQGNKHTINFGADAINVSVSAETAAKLGLTSAADLEAVLAKIAAHSHSAADVGAIPTSDKGKAGGVATLGSDGKVPTSQLPEMDYDAAGSAAAVQRNLDAHTANQQNPHGVTAEQVGARPASWTPTAADVGAAPASHTTDTTIHITASERSAWNAKAAKPTVRTLTLSTAGWDSTAKTQTVTCSGVSSDETAQLITVTPALASQSAYLESGIRCTAQAANALTFTATTVPTAALTVYAVIQTM